MYQVEMLDVNHGKKTTNIYARLCKHMSVLLPYYHPFSGAMAVSFRECSYLKISVASWDLRKETLYTTRKFKSTCHSANPKR